MRQPPASCRPDSGPVWPIQGRRDAQLPLFSADSINPAARSLAAFRTARGWTAVGRDGKYDAEFSGEFGVVLMADVSSGKGKRQTRVLRALPQPPDLPRPHRDAAGNPARQARERFARMRSPTRSSRPPTPTRSARRATNCRRKYHVNKDLIARAPNLLIVSTGGAGYDTVNVKDCTDAGVLVVNQTGGNADAVAAHVLGMMLMLSKQVVQVNNALRKGTMKDRNLYMGNDINNKTIGIVGLGNVGRRLAKLCATVFDMTVLAYDPLLDEKTIAERNATKVELDELCRRSDFISINCPLDDTTRNMISTRQFGLMQKHAYFITAARGFITDEKALEEALRNKQIAGAGLDVFVEGAAGDGPPAAAIRQRDREPAHRRRHQGGPRQHGQIRGRATDPDARRQASRRAWSTPRCGRPMPSASNAPLASARRARPHDQQIPCALRRPDRARQHRPERHAGQRPALLRRTAARGVRDREGRRADHGRA